MNLLPKSFQEFGEKEYWNKFFGQRQNRAFEWYGDYNQLSSILHKFIKVKDNILVVGCGNSKLSADLYDVGLQRITNIDVSPVAIKAMSEQHKKQRPEMSWHLMDVTKMDFKDDEFSVILDKGTLDALLTSTTHEVVQQIDAMFSEISRVLKFGGRYVCVSLLQAHILDTLLEWFTSRGWMVRICRRLDDEDELAADNAKQRLSFPVFVAVCTKFKAMPGVEPVLEAALDGESPVRTDKAQLKQSVSALQQYAILRHQISKGSIGDKDISLSLYDGRSSTSWRYQLHVVDWSRASSTKFAIFIVPHGRESQWIFGTPQGRRQLAESTGFERLVVVHLNREHDYVNLDKIKSELSSKVMELAPAGLSRKALVPFLSVGEDLRKLVPVHKGVSESSGEFVVEDVEGDDELWFRQLVFTANSNIVQSEARLHRAPFKKSRKKSTRKLIDHSYLACQHHKYIVGSLALLHGLQEEKPRQIKVLIVGLGGGGLPSFLHRAFDNMSIDVVEIDPAMMKVATDWFEFPVSESLRVHVADGIDYIAKAKTEGLIYDIVVLDVDSKDSSVGMSCPPKSFVEMENLRNCKHIIREPGIFVLNLVCRDANLRKETLSKLKEVFPQLHGVKVEQEVNEIIYGLTTTKNVDALKATLSSTLSELDANVRECLKLKGSFFQVREFIKSLSFL